MTSDPHLLDGLYGRRFPEEEVRAKEALWRVLAAYLQRFVDPRAPVLDIACDRGHFIRNIDASEKWATDVRDVREHLPADVRFVNSDGLRLAESLPAAHFGTIFMSNYLEHLPSSDAVLQQLEVAHGLTRDGGRIVILQPNIRLVGGRYWDFLDHHVPLTEASLREACEAAGFRTELTRVRFLPYTTKSRLPNAPWLVRSYLAFRPAQWLMGKQTLFVGVRAG